MKKNYPMRDSDLWMLQFWYQSYRQFLIAILHHDLWNCFFFDTFHLLSIFHLDFYFPSPFGLLFPFSIWTFISLFYNDLIQFFFFQLHTYIFLFNLGQILDFFQNFCWRWLVIGMLITWFHEFWITNFDELWIQLDDNFFSWDFWVPKKLTCNRNVTNWD